MKDSTISNILYSVGVVILLVTHLIMLKNGKDTNIYLHLILVFPGIIFIITAWIVEIKVRKEKYDYNYALQSGNLIGGTVYASNPSNVPGLGWVL